MEAHGTKSNCVLQSVSAGSLQRLLGPPAAQRGVRGPPCVSSPAEKQPQTCPLPPQGDCSGGTMRHDHQTPLQLAEGLGPGWGLWPDTLQVCVLRTEWELHISRRGFSYRGLGSWALMSPEGARWCVVIHILGREGRALSLSLSPFFVSLSRALGSSDLWRLYLQLSEIIVLLLKSVGWASFALASQRRWCISRVSAVHGFAWSDTWRCTSARDDEWLNHYLDFHLIRSNFSIVAILFLFSGILFGILCCRV